MGGEGASRPGHEELGAGGGRPGGPQSGLLGWICWGGGPSVLAAVCGYGGRGSSRFRQCARLCTTGSRVGCSGIARWIATLRRRCSCWEQSTNPRSSNPSSHRCVSSGRLDVVVCVVLSPDLPRVLDYGDVSVTTSMAFLYSGDQRIDEGLTDRCERSSRSRVLKPLNRPGTLPETLLSEWRQFSAESHTSEGCGLRVPDWRKALVLVVSGEGGIAVVAQPVPDDLAARIRRLSPAEQRRAMAYVERLEHAGRGTALLSLVNVIPDDELDVMAAAIEADCERVDASDW